MFSHAWDRIQVSSAVHVSKCIFTHLKAENGGAIFSSYDAEHKLLYDSFYLCNATQENSGRGGAFFFQKGDISVKGCCANTCNGVYTSDMISHCPTKGRYFLVSSDKATANKHSFYSSGKSCNELKHMNISNSMTTEVTTYACGVNVAGTSNIIERFINIVDCSGPNGVMCIDYGSNIDISIEYVNVLKPSNVIAVLVVQSCQNCKCVIKSSSFVQTNCKLGNVPATNTVLFSSCRFSMQEPGEESLVTKEGCSFNTVFAEEVHNKYYSCYINLARVWCTNRQMRYQGNRFVLIICLALSK